MTERTKDDPIVIDAPESWELFESPVRFDLLTHLERLPEASVAELAARSGRPADSLYHHLHRLEAVGLVVQSGWRKSGRNAEALYALSGSRIEFDFDLEEGRNREPFRRMVRAIFRNATRVFEALAEGCGVIPRGPTKNVHIRQESVRLTSEDLRQLNEKLGEISDLLNAASSRDSGEVHSITWAVAPRATVERKRGTARKGASQRKRTS